VVNKEAFYKLLQDPARIAPDGLQSLEELVRVFPFCSLAHALIAKSHYDQATMLASQKLRKAAAYAVNRNKLKKIIYGDWPEEDIAALPPLVDRPVSFQTQPEPLAPPALPEIQLPPAPEPIGGTQPGEIDPEMPSELVFERLVAPLQLTSPKLPAGEEETEPEEPPLQLGRLNADDLPIERFSRRAKKHLEREIIESFIRSEPRISSLSLAEAEPASRRDLSERSTQPVEIVSENMANIYIRQRKFDKAVQMFEKLMVKYPEKKEIFAKRIQELKQL